MLIITALALVIAALGIGYVIGRARGGAAAPAHAIPGEPASASTSRAAPEPPSVSGPAPVETPAMSPPEDHAPAGDRMDAERARIIRSYEAEAATLRRELVARDAAIVQLAAFAAERRRLFDELASSRGETARYRQLVIDLENNAPPPFFGIEAPDDLKLIVGVGPVLERMLQQLGVATYRQIARWSERDIDEFDAKLHEFPGRIRRDAWVTQARSLHQSKYGEALPLRERG